jgi:2-oxoglutarate dehydrogenase E2 component (dihydrolipoamide succinyltransferase)
MSAEIRVPEFGESITEATVSRWLKQKGDLVSAGEAVVELETEKADVEVSAEHPGVLARIERKNGENVRVGDVLGLIEDAAQASLHSAQDEKRERGEAQDTPLAARVAKEQGVEASGIEVGPGSRVTKEDIEIPLARQKKEAPSAARSVAESRLSRKRERPEERQHMSRRRQTIARRLLEATQTTAMLTSFNEVDMTAVMDIRESQKEAFAAKHKVRLGIVSFFVKAVIVALKAFPILNAELQGDEIVFKHYYDIGVAIGAPEGLVVPVVRDADRLSFAQIEKAIKKFAEQVQEKTLALEDLQGGTFTITNGGVFGSLMSTPILNPPEVGILGLHKIHNRPITYDGEIVVRPMMYLALTYDHRIVDGRDAVQFLVCIREVIESPERLLLVT